MVLRILDATFRLIIGVSFSWVFTPSENLVQERTKGEFPLVLVT